jgi:serine phosphatase RsbU (regulator of sigma subunit)
MTAGLVMAVAHAAFRTQLDIDPSPAAIMAALNRILCRTGSTRSFFSSCYLVIAPDGSFVATLAGHPQIIKVNAAGKVVDRLGIGSYPLGIKSDLAWQSISGTLAAGESLVLHSDGLTEARSESGQDLGDEYLESVIGWFPGAPATDLVQSIVAEWQSFTNRRPPEDDVSIAVIRHNS